MQNATFGGPIYTNLSDFFTPVHNTIQHSPGNSPQGHTFDFFHSFLAPITEAGVEFIKKGWPFQIMEVIFLKEIHQLHHFQKHRTVSSSKSILRKLYSNIYCLLKIMRMTLIPDTRE